MSFLPAPISFFRRVSGALSVGVLSLLCAAPHAWAQGFTTDDTQLRFDGTSVSPAGATARAGFTGSPTPGGGIVPIFVYRLPTLAAGTTITSAVLSFNLAGVTVPGSINYNVDLYALGFRSTPTITASDFFVGASDSSPTATLIQNNFVPLSSPASSTPLGRYQTNGTSSLTLATFLNSQYNAGAVGGPSGSYVFFRLSPDQTSGLGFGGYDFSTQDNTAASGLRPALTITTGSSTAAPEPSSVALLATATVMLGGIRGTLRRRRSK